VRNERQDEAAMLDYADQIGVDRAEFVAALAEVPMMSLERFELIAQALFSVAKELSTVAYQNVQQARFITDRARIERELAEEQARGLQRLQRSLSSIVEIVSHVAETRDPYTAGHQRRVSELAVRIAEEMGMPAAQIEDIRIASLLHDIGKMSIPAEILSKPGALSTIEFELIKGHSESGYRIIASADMEGPIADIVYQHHERCDGSGYPQGLSEAELLAESKVLMVADVVEAMVSHRPYRPGLGIVAALGEIERGSGSGYDSDVVDACLVVFNERGFEFSSA
jgi:putative nucleotidyltransferase with HDIG domain